MPLRHIIVTALPSIATVASPRGRYARMQQRPTYGLTFCQSGRITYSHQGQQWISDQNHALLLPQGETYSLYGNESGNFPVINFTTTPDTSIHSFLSFSLDNPDSFLKDYRRMQRLLLFDPRHPLAMSIFYDMLHRLTDLPQPQSKLLAPAMAYLQQHYADPTLTNEILARQSDISPAYFQRLFRKAHGISPHQYILDVRIRRAQQLLCEGNTTVTFIAEACGFASVYHFCRAFKQYTGQTPTEFSALHSTG